MSLSCGVVGLPNAGKSTLFNALTAAGAEVAGYPFCTVDRNIGSALVPDQRLGQVARFAGSAKQTPATLQVVDIAGLVRGASRGEGLGNKFLGHIREVDCLLHLVRCFDHPGAPHVLGSIDPVRDARVVGAELMLADLATLERRREKLRTPAKVSEGPARRELALVDELSAALDAGREIRWGGLSPAAMAAAAGHNLLTAKPVVYVANVPDPGPTPEPLAALRELARSEGAGFVEVYARALMDLGEFDPAERDQVAAELGISLEPLGAVIRAAYGALDLITFFTANRHEARAWSLRRGSDSVAAAAKVHSDFARGFIAVEVLGPAGYQACANRGEAQRAGMLRLEGREYPVAEGDLCEFRFSV